MQGKGTSGLLTMRTAEAGKWISDRGEFDDSDLGAVQAGPLMAQRQFSQGWQDPCMDDGGVKGKNQYLGLSLGWRK
jgi:hypothetical protein